MKVLCVDSDSCGLAFVMRCEQAGHDTRWYLRTHNGGEPRADGDGVPGVVKVNDLQDALRWVGKDGLVFATNNDAYIDELDQWRRFGWSIFGPTRASANLEVNRGLGMEVMQSVGIRVPPYEEFDTLQKAENYARKSGKRMVFKTLGSDEDKSRTYVGKSPADMVGRIERWRKAGVKIKGSVMLQDYVEGIEFGVSGWFGPDGFLRGKWNESWEHKRLMSGNYGPNTGETATLMRYTDESKLADETLLPMEDYLRGAGHIGDFAVNCIIDGKGNAWPMEFTARAGWPANVIMASTHKTEAALWMKRLIEGRDSLKVDYDPVIGVIIAAHDYPFCERPAKDCQGLPIGGIEPGPLPPDIWPFQMRQAIGPKMDGDKVVDGPIYETSGPYVMVVTASGSTISEAHEAVYERVDEIDLCDKLVRDDAGERLEEELPLLQKHGYALGLKY